MYSFGPQNIVTVQLVSDQISINLRKSLSRGNGDSWQHLHFLFNKSKNNKRKKSFT